MEGNGSRLTNRYREGRESRGMSTDEAASRIGVTAATMRSWETGRTAPSAVSLAAMARCYDVSSDWLLGLI